MKDFVDFVSEAAGDADLGKAAFECIQAGDVGALVKFFESKGYKVSEADAKKLIEHKASFNNKQQIEGLQAGY